jgi:type IV pilus assembly protein PilN
MTSMNLLPWRQVLRSRRKKENIMTIIYAAGFAVCLVFLITLGLSIKIANEEKNGQYLQDKIISLDKSLQEIKGLEIKKTELIGKINVLQGLHSPRADTAKIFDELVVAIPANITVFSIKRNGNTVAVTGFANSNSDVSILMRNIESSSLLANARLLEIEQQVIDGAITNQFYMDIEVDSI